MDIKYIGSKEAIQQARQYILGVDFASSNDAAVQNLMCLSCKGVIETSKYDSTLPGFEFEIPSECPLCGVQIRKAVLV